LQTDKRSRSHPCTCAGFGELLYGALNSQRIRENQEAVHQFLRYALFVPCDENIAARYASVRHRLRKIGRPIPENDIWIAPRVLNLMSLCLQETFILKVLRDCG